AKHSCQGVLAGMRDRQGDREPAGELGFMLAWRQQRHWPMQRVQDQIARKWHGLRQQMADAAVPARLAARKNELLLAVLLTAFFLTGALSAAHALIGVALVAAWAAWWP